MRLRSFTKIYLYTDRFPFSGADAAIKMRPREDELEELGPDFQEYWGKSFANNPDKPLFWLSACAGYVERFQHLQFKSHRSG